MYLTFILILSLFTTGFCKWEFIWGDEFEGDTLNLDEWYFDLGCSGWGNEELQCYTENRHENVRVEDGNLVINVQVEEYDGHDFTSARLKSKTAWTYGYFETRVKLPSGHHLWPAIRMMPQDNVYGEWAASGEIDIMEFSGDDLHGIQGTIHCGGTAPNNIRFGSDQRHFPFDFSEDFHVFAIDWSPYGFRFVIDGNEYHWEGIEKSMWSGKGENPYTADGQPFDQSFFWILNIAVGGTFFGDGPYVTPDEARDWPKPTMEVDYVRVWRYAPD